MSWFERIEEACAAFIERAFANMFPSDLEPAQIARKLVATMEARTQNIDNVLVAPDRYGVFVNPSDYARLAPHRPYLEKEWSALIADVAARVGIAFQADAPHVALHEDDRVVAGAIDVDVEYDEEQRRPSSTVTLRVIAGLPAERVFQVSGALRVGRHPQCDIVLPDPSVSRNHALLDVHRGDLIVHDAGSTNGTYVNGERVETRALRRGDVVAFGKTQLRVEDAGA